MIESSPTPPLTMVFFLSLTFSLANIYKLILIFTTVTFFTKRFIARWYFLILLVSISLVLFIGYIMLYLKETTAQFEMKYFLTSEMLPLIMSALIFSSLITTLSYITSSVGVKIGLIREIQSVYGKIDEKLLKLFTFIFYLLLFWPTIIYLYFINEPGDLFPSEIIELGNFMSMLVIIGILIIAYNPVKSEIISNNTPDRNSHKLIWIYILIFIISLFVGLIQGDFLYFSI